MASFKKSPTKIWSRVKNDLAELQPWWPVHIKNDSDLSISIDPVLYRSDFSTGSDTVDEATTAGIRVEAIQDDGTDVTGTEPTITISGSGTFNPRMTINHSDGTSSTWLLVAPTFELSPNQAANLAADNFHRQSGSTTGYINAETTIRPQIGAGTTQFYEKRSGSASKVGPYPVFMTLQEAVELIDTYRHIGLANDSTKPAWLPHGIGDGGTLGYTPQDPNPAVNLDPRITGNAVLPTTAPYRATVFMPMLLDNNQLARDITGATNAHGDWNIGTKVLAVNGVTRYITDPEGSDSALIKYKTVGKSGDHKLSQNHKGQYCGARNHLRASTALTTDFRHSYRDDGLFAFSRDSTAVGAPNYRMSMALACFLKDGTYSLNDGTIIPYSYDNNRYIGGTTTDTLYMTWDGEAGFGDGASGGGARAGHLPYKDTRNAGIYPFFDFVQGPISPAAQGMNWSWKSTDPIRNSGQSGVTDSVWKWDDATADINNITSITAVNYIPYGYGDVPPNARPARIVAAERTATGDVKLWVPHAMDGFSGASATDAQHMPIPTGLPIYVSGLTGVLGTDNPAHSANNKVFPTKFDNRRGADASAAAKEKEMNGWWLPRRVEYYGTASDIPNEKARFAGSNMTPDAVVAGCAAEHFGGDNSSQAWVVYVIRPFHGYKPPTATVAAYLVTAGAELKQGRNYGGQYGVGAAYMLNSSNVQTGVEERVIGDSVTNTGSTEPTKVQSRGVYPYNPYTFIWTPTTEHGMTGDTSVISGGQVLPFSLGWLCGWNTPDSNVPSSASANDTYPARPTVGHFALPDPLGNFTDNRPVPRSITIQTINSANDMKIESAPTAATKGDGVLRVPAPLGHDLCMRYNSISWTNYQSPYTWKSHGASGTNGIENDAWVPRSDLANFPIVRPDKWANRGVSTPLWSFMDGATGRHAWDYIKPTGWSYGRNRCWPAHKRQGTRLAISPSLGEGGGYASSPDGGTTTNDQYVTPQQATSRIGISEIGVSPIFLDMTMTGFIPADDNRMVMIEFDRGESDSVLGQHSMISSLDNRDMGFGFTPPWNGQQLESVFLTYPYQDENYTEVDFAGAGTPYTLQTTIDGYPEFENIVQAYDIGNGVFGDAPVKASFGTFNSGFLGLTASSDPNDGYPYTPRSSVRSRTAIWFMSANSQYTANTWTNADTYTLAGTMGYGVMNATMGQGSSYTEGTNEVRAVFTEGGMKVALNGTDLDTASVAKGEIYGIAWKSCALQTFPFRNPFCLTDGKGGTDNILEYKHIKEEEPSGYARTMGSTTTNRFGYYLWDNDTSALMVDATTFASHDDTFPRMMPVPPTKFKNSINKMISAESPCVNVSNKDLQIDELVLRQIPTPAMLPFTVDTIKQQASVTPAKYTSLVVEADNIDAAKNMRITATIMEAPTYSNIASEASVPVVGFEDIDLQFVAGFGAADLTGLPAAQVTNGFVIRFNFYIPSSEDTDLHPINWKAVPAIKSWQIFFDHKPTSDLSVVGNTFDGSTATTVGTSGTQTCTSKVGHIVSFTVRGDTTDPDRKISALKLDFGDGTDSGFINLPTPLVATNATYNLSHVYSSRPASGYVDATVIARDDNDNDSAISDAIRITLTAGEPVAVLKTIPSTVRAGQAIRLDGADSYTIDTDSTISNYAWTFGDGSTGVNGATKYNDHTYATAGEFMATLIVTDSLSSVSPVSKAVVKVLPATLVVPLVLNTRPNSFSRTRMANLSQTPVLDAIYPEVNDTGQRGDSFQLTGAFLQATQNQDIEFMEELLLSGALVEFDWQEVNYVGTADTKTFVGRLVSFDYNRAGGQIDMTPYTATFVREAGLGV